MIRDLNDAVLKQPYDEELKIIVKGFADLVKPMVETVDRHGLKSRFLRKHLVSVDRFTGAFQKQTFGASKQEHSRVVSRKIERSYSPFWYMMAYPGTIIMPNMRSRHLQLFAV